MKKKKLTKFQKRSNYKVLKGLVENLIDMYGKEGAIPYLRTLLRKPEKKGQL